VLLAVLGDVADARVVGLVRVGLGEVEVAEGHLPRHDLAHAGQASTSSRWPLPSTPATPTISPGAHGQGETVDGPEVAVVLDVQVGDREHRVGRGRVGLVDRENDLAPDHHGGQVAGVGGRGLDLADDGALAQHVDPVGHREHLAQLVRDEDDRRARGRELLHDTEQLVGLLRREHRGRLVEDEQVDPAAESALRISTRCWVPTGRSSISASGSTAARAWPTGCAPSRGRS
jgi:hypothetical protein